MRIPYLSSSMKVPLYDETRRAIVTPVESRTKTPMYKKKQKNRRRKELALKSKKVNWRRNR